MSRPSLVIVVLIIALSAGQARGQTLTLTGNCPGVMTFTVTNATPFSRIAFLHANGAGSFVIPFGLVCGGTVTGLNNSITLAGFATTNNVGTVVVNANIPPNWCGNRFGQVIDTTPCSTSNVILIQ